MKYRHKPGSDPHWLYVSTHYATFAVKIVNGRVVEGPDIAKGWRGKREQELVAFYRYRRKGIVEVLE